jgi:hypothetical protein
MPSNYMAVAGAASVANHLQNLHALAAAAAPVNYDPAAGLAPNLQVLPAAVFFHSPAAAGAGGLQRLQLDKL